ncbi:hypothetical protein [Chitinophaga sp. Cy-1792]|uniref:hypothetical protein n=1 Tax=Chitinophaga sp. Cy-1792 TaxID=2608339 RepID=UPI00141DE8DF|nr:hypothetical protein [Chitinophaga sp. Cy-1792]NIG55170.1 hypothetical protein [Chitinophaga sp. Cy-1792]
MLSTLTALCLLSFVAHVFLLFTAFNKSGVNKGKYLWSHITLWLAGILACVITLMFAGKGVSSLVDVFDTPVKSGMLIVLAFALSLIAHTVVRKLVMPRYAK